MHRDARLRRAVLETLESRQLLSTYYVSTEGDDADDGSETRPWRTLQQAADSVEAGDIVNVALGDYVGFAIGWDEPGGGTAADPITFRGQWAEIVAPNPHSPHGIYIGPGSDHVVIQQFHVDGRDGDMQAAIRVERSDDVVIRRVFMYGDGAAAVSARNTVGLNVSKTEISQGWATAILVTGGQGPVLRGNKIRDSERHGIRLHGAREPISGARVRGNTIQSTGAGGAAIDAAAVYYSDFSNNVLSQNDGHGMLLRDVDGVGGTKHNHVVNNTIHQGPTGGWAVKLTGRSTGNTLFNNILLVRESSAGALRIDEDSVPGFESDYNVLTGALSTVGGVNVSLSEWQGATGLDAHSFVALAGELFIDGTSYPFERSRAVNAGTDRGATGEDVNGIARPAGGRIDIGAVEHPGPFRQAPYTPSSKGTSEGAIHRAGATGLEPVFFEGFDPPTLVIVDGNYQLGPAWERLAWDGGTAPRLSVGGGDLDLIGGVLRTVAPIGGAAAEGEIRFQRGPGLEADAVAHMFGFGTDFRALEGNYWAAFVTKGAYDTLYAQVNLGGTITEIPLGALDPQNVHVYRVEPRANRFRFYVDGRVLGVIEGTFPGGTENHLMVAAHARADDLHAEWLEAALYESGGRYVSPVYDDRVSAPWGAIGWDADLPKATSIVVETSSGETATPDGTWSAWQAPDADGRVASPAGRYIRYRVTFFTSVLTRTAKLRAVNIAPRLSP